MTNEVDRPKRYGHTHYTDADRVQSDPSDRNDVVLQPALRVRKKR